jgi:hypothetical protein
MEISGKVIKILPLQSGEGKNGRWQKQEFIIEIPGQFPKKLCLSLWGDKVTQNPLTEGQQVSVSFDLESKEFNNRWYTDAKVWKVTSQQNMSAATPPPPGTKNDDAFSSLSDNDIPGNDNFLSKDLTDDGDSPF